MKSIIKTYLVELNFITAPAALTQVHFIDQPQLREARIIGIEAISANQLLTSPAGKTMVTNSMALDTALTLKVGTEEIIYQMPYAQFVTQNNGGIIREFNGIVINFQQSGVNCFAATIPANYSICYNFWYVNKADWQIYFQLRQKNGRLF